MQYSLSYPLLDCKGKSNMKLSLSLIKLHAMKVSEGMEV